jgi:Ca2+-binding EF-hand superfamily protein
MRNEDSALIQAVPTWDGNKDGTVTCEEWKSYADALFNQFDGGKDGFLIAGEYRALAQADRLFEVVPLDYFDGDGDGRVSRSEFVNKPNRAFAVLDKNKDCALGRDEFRQPSPPQPGGPGGKGMPKGGPGGGSGGPGGPGGM